MAMNNALDFHEDMDEMAKQFVLNGSRNTGIYQGIVELMSLQARNHITNSDEILRNLCSPSNL